MIWSTTFYYGSDWSESNRRLQIKAKTRQLGVKFACPGSFLNSRHLPVYGCFLGRLPAAAFPVFSPPLLLLATVRQLQPSDVQVVAPRPGLPSWPLGIIGRHPKKTGTKGAHENHLGLLTLPTHTKWANHSDISPRHRHSHSLAPPLTENTPNGAFR